MFIVCHSNRDQHLKLFLRRLLHSFNLKSYKICLILSLICLYLSCKYSISL